MGRWARRFRELHRMHRSAVPDALGEVEVEALGTVANGATGFSDLHHLENQFRGETHHG